MAVKTIVTEICADTWDTFFLFGERIYAVLWGGSNVWVML